MSTTQEDFGWKYWVNIALRKILLYTNINLQEHHKLQLTYKFRKNTNILNKSNIDSDYKGFAELEHLDFGGSTS